MKMPRRCGNIPERGRTLVTRIGTPMITDSPKLCECGCGQPAPIARKTNNKLGIIKGHPLRFIPTHHNRIQFPSAEDRFWSRTDKTGPIPAHRPELGPCWLWIGPVSKAGYGQISVANKRQYAHRFSYELHQGSLDANMSVCHHCDTPRCVNPNHLFSGTKGENSDDMVSKERQAHGTRNKRAKLNEADIKRIRDLAQVGLNTIQLADMFGVADSTISRILHRRNWKYVQ